MQWPRQFHHNGSEWTILGLCGNGTFASCYHVRNNGDKHNYNNGEEFALKICKQAGKFHAAFDNEIKVLCSIKDILRTQNEFASYFIKYFGHFTLFNHKCMLMELASYNLEQLMARTQMNKLSVYLVRILLQSLVSGLTFLESCSLAHGDIKPSNVLWSFNLNCFQLCDFGLSFTVGQQPRHLLQSPGFRAPEVLRWNEMLTEDRYHVLASDVHLNTAIDVWGIGCVLFYAITGKYFYATEHAQKLPSLCTNCVQLSSSSYNNCIHILRLHEVFASDLITMFQQPNDAVNMKCILSGFLQCASNQRLIWLKHASDNPLLANNEQDRISIMDSVLLPSRVIRLMSIFKTEDMDEKEDIMSDIKEECEKLGPVLSITSSKTNTSEAYHVYAEFVYVFDSIRAQEVLTGRQFDNHLVIATFFPIHDFLAENFY